MTGHPGRIKNTIDIRLPRPRTAGDMRASADYGSIVHRVWEILNDTEGNSREPGNSGLADKIAPTARL
jgi:NitT/TauT family transport system ATP-binding protein